MGEDLPPLALRYLSELGLGVDEVPPGTEDTLVRVHHAHALRFAHDTLWMSRGRVPPVDYETMVQWLLAGEGGACVSLNAGLAWLLRHLGFEVELHRARVVQGFGGEPTDREAHLILQVLVDGRPWLADTGLGSGLLDPVPLEAGTYQQGAYTYVLERSPGDEVAHELHVDTRLMGVRTILWEDRAVDLSATEKGYYFHSTDPASAYVQNLTAHRRTETGALVLNNRVVVRIVDRKRRMESISDPQRWEQVLREEFHLGLPELTPAELTELWERSGRAADPASSSDGA